MSSQVFMFTSKPQLRVKSGAGWDSLSAQAGGYENKVVLPHERTFPASGPPDCWRQQANFSQIFCFYEDPSRSVDDLLRAQSDAADHRSDRECHRLWPVYNPAIIRYLQAYFADRQVFIADVPPVGVGPGPAGGGQAAPSAL